MAKKFTELRAGMSQAAREKADSMARQMLTKEVHVQQPSPIDGDPDGVARFPNGSVKINNFTELGATASL